MKNEDILNFSFVFKQIVSLIVGLFFGIIKITGKQGIIMYLVIANLGYLMLCRKYFKKDELEIESSKILSEGLMPSFGLFLLVWTATYSCHNLTN